MLIDLACISSHQSGKEHIFLCLGKILVVHPFLSLQEYATHLIWLFFIFITIAWLCATSVWGVSEAVCNQLGSPNMHLRWFFWRGEAWQFWAWFRERAGGRQLNSRRLGRAATRILCLVLCWFSLSVCFSSWASCPAPEPHSFLPYFFCLSCCFCSLFDTWYHKAICDAQPCNSNFGRFCCVNAVLEFQQVSQ